MANNKYLIVDNYEELLAIENRHHELMRAPLILLSDSFNLEQLASFKKRGYQYFDDAISDIDAKTMSTAIHDIMWNWFRDEKGDDLSLIDGLSLGLTFSSSMEILLNSIIKYEVAFSKILKAGDEIYYVLYTDDVFLAVIEELKFKIGFVLKVVHVEGKHRIVLYGKKKLKLDPGARKRDLAPYFKINRRAAFIYGLLKIIRGLCPARTNKDSVLLYSAGKLDEFIKAKTRDPYWILPFSSLKDILRMISGKLSSTSRFYFETTNNSVKKTKQIVSILEQNLLRIKGVNNKSLLALMKIYIFNYASGAVSFYMNVCREITALDPRLVIISTDVIEPHVIVAQAAKRSGKKVALLPHGIDDWGYKELRTGESQIIDYCLAYGNKHVWDNIAHGVSEDRIKLTSFPYFSKFIAYPRELKKAENKKALVLTYDYNNMSPASKQGYFFKCLQDLIIMLAQLHIDLLGIKSRGDNDIVSHGVKDSYIEYNGQKIQWFTGYTSFPEIAEKADLIIGNSSTALIEAGLLGKDYFVFRQEGDAIIPSISHSVEKMMYVANNIKELKENIINCRTYRPGYSISDMIDFEGVNNKNDLYNKFEKSIKELMSLPHSR